MTAHEKILQLAAEVRLPIDALMQPLALLGNRGGGKTYCGQAIFELAHDVGVQCVAIDVVGKWWALRMGKNGKAEGGLADVYIFGGKHADFPITPDRGAFVAKVIVENRIHAVIDLSLMRKADRRRFLVDFAEELFLLKKQEDAPLPSVLFLEEAHAVLPQKTFGPDDARMLGAFEDIVREGRNHGIGVVIMDQRPATVNKNALALIEILIALRITYKIDRDVIEDWIVQKGADAQVKLGEVLPFLKAGQGYLYAPIYDLFKRVTINPKRTYDASQTAKIGQAARVIGKLTPVDVEKVREAMAEVVAAVASKDPTKLIARAARAETDLASALKKIAELQAKPATTKPGKRIEVQVVKEAVVAKLEGALAKAHAVVDLITKTMADARAMNAVVNRLPPAEPRPYRATAADLATSPSRALRSVVAAVEPIDGFQPAAGERKMLAVLASRAPTALTRSQLRTLSGFTDGTFRTYGPRLHRNGLIEIHGDHYSITNAGAAVIGDVPPTQSADEVLAMWKKNLAAGECAILDLLSRESSHTFPTTEIQDATGFTAGTLRTYLPRLERLGLIDDVGGKNFQISKDLVA